MRLPRYAVYVILLLLFALAAWIRIDRSSQSESPYFRGESGTHYRYAYMISQRGHLPQIDKKAAFPEGYDPARVKAMGVEFMTGYLCKLVRYFSTMSERTFVRIFTALFYSLMVWIVFGLSCTLWRCKAGALFSSALVAFSMPLIAATDGSVFTPLPYAAVGAGLHLLLMLRYLKNPTLRTALAASVAAFALASFWEGALIYLLPAFFLAVWRARRDHSTLLKFALPHLAAAIAAILLFHFGSGETAWRWSYLGYRLKYMFGKPSDPALLPDTIRLLWTRAHGSPPAYTLLAFFLPLVVLIPPVAGGLRMIARERGTSIRVVASAATALAILFIIDKSTIVFAAPALALLASPAFYSFTRKIKTRIIFVALGCFLLFGQLAYPRSTADLTYRVGTAIGMTLGGSDEFTRVSIGDADLDLVTFLSTRTSTREPFLASPELSTLILTFAGRTTTLMPGIVTAQMFEKTLALLGPLYTDEADLYRTCTGLSISYVLYSIDMVLDDSRYSLRYLNGAVDLDRESAAFKMHFFPEDLSHFELIYENDIYRVFRVAGEARPIFLSDHPPVYQYELLMKNSDDLSTFYERIVGIISTYALAVDAHARGEWDAALERYQWCINEAPQFTRARLGMGGAFLAQEEWQLAKPVFLSIVRYAPDNQEALFGAAYAMYYLEEWEDARRYLNILIATPGRDREIVKRARGLRMAIAEKLETSK